MARNRRIERSCTFWISRWKGASSSASRITSASSGEFSWSTAESERLMGCISFWIATISS